MKVVSFNVNGIRARLHQLEALEAKHSPDIVAIQESKAQDADFPRDAVAELGFPHVEIYGQKSHFGVALLSKTAPTNLVLGVSWRVAEQ